jgi:hypothetical protein
MSPAPPDRVAPIRNCEVGVRRRAEVQGSVNKSAARTGNQPQTELRHASGVSTGGDGHSRRKAGSCYCESVWWVVPDGIGPIEMPSKGPGFATGARKGDRSSRSESCLPRSA